MIRKFRRMLRRRIEARRQRGMLAALETHAPQARANFERLAPRFAARYEAAASQPFERFVTQTWREFNARIEGALLPQPRFAFLADATLRQTMFRTAQGAHMAQQRGFLEERVGFEFLARWVREDPTGAPGIHAPDLMTSHNAIHHAYHLERYEAAVGGLLEPEHVVEWGGGYGSLARLFLRRHTGNPTYTIVDTPLLSCLQWLYLSSVLGEDRVRLLSSREDSIEPGLVNLLPLGLLDQHAATLRSDLFISTWALSESGPASVELVGRRAWFDASRLLLAFQGPSETHPGAALVRRLAADAGAVSLDIPFLAGSRYAFR